MKKFAGRVAVITGAGGGIGGALATELAHRKCHLALVDLNSESLTKTADSLAASGVRVTTHQADVTDRNRMEKLPDEIVAAHGGVNLLINNAGITLQKSFMTHSLADWERMIGINLWGVIYGCHFFKPALDAADEAHIVNMSSMAGFIGLPAQSSYCSTKAAVRAFSESIWAEFNAQGIGVTAVAPGAIKTDMIMATLEESDDLEVAKKNFEMVQKIGTDADKAATTILQAVEKNKRQVRIGKDAILIDVLKRFCPALIHGLFLKVAKKQFNAALTKAQ